MKYISFIDQLGLDLDTLATIDSHGIINLQKQLKAQAMLGDAANLGDVSDTIEKLKDDRIRNCYVFVEKHPWLKLLICGEYDAITQKEINVDRSIIADLETLKSFLAPYLKDHLTPFLTFIFKKGKMVLLLKVLGNTFLFSEANNQLIITFFKSRLNYATAYLRENRLKTQELPINFITNKVFVNCLNEYPDTFNNEVQELNSEVIDIYNAKRRNIDNKEFKFAAKSMVAFSQLETSNVFLKEMLVSNGNIAKEYAYRSSSRRTGSGFGGWSTFVFVLLVIRLIFYIGKTSSDDYIRPGNIQISPYSTNSKLPEDLMRQIESIQNINRQDKSTLPTTESTSDTLRPVETDRYKLDNHIKFLYTLKRNVKRKGKDSDNAMATVVPFSNPYPTTFNVIPHERKANADTLITIRNKSKRDLIVFRLTPGIDQSVFIPENASATLHIVNDDSLVFYTGKHFTTGRFSFFKDQTDLSPLYKIKTKQEYTAKQITIYPFSDKVVKVNSSSSGKVLIDSSRVEKIKSNHVELEALSIDKLYTNYYNRKYRN